MKVSLKRKTTIYFKEIICKIILFFLYRGFKVIYKYDNNLKEEIDNWNDNFSIQIQLKTNGSSLYLKKTNEGIIKVKKINNPDILICFKSIDSAFLVLIGKIGISQAYAQHRFTLKGGIAEAMSLVRCIDIIEAYLFPKIITKRILEEIPKKELNIIETYIRIMFNININKKMRHYKTIFNVSKGERL